MRTFFMVIFGLLGIAFVYLVELKQKEENRKELLKIKYIDNVLFIIGAVEVILFALALILE